MKKTILNQYGIFLITLYLYYILGNLSVSNSSKFKILNSKYKNKLETSLKIANKNEFFTSTKNSLQQQQSKRKCSNSILFKTTAVFLSSFEQILNNQDQNSIAFSNYPLDAIIIKDDYTLSIESTETGNVKDILLLGNLLLLCKDYLMVCTFSELELLLGESFKINRDSDSANNPISFLEMKIDPKIEKKVETQKQYLNIENNDTIKETFGIDEKINKEREYTNLNSRLKTAISSKKSKAKNKTTTSTDLTAETCLSNLDQSGIISPNNCIVLVTDRTFTYFIRSKAICFDNKFEANKFKHILSKKIFINITKNIAPLYKIRPLVFEEVDHRTLGSLRNYSKLSNFLKNKSIRGSQNKSEYYRNSEFNETQPTSSSIMTKENEVFRASDNDRNKRHEGQKKMALKRNSGNKYAKKVALIFKDNYFSITKGDSAKIYYTEINNFFKFKSLDQKTFDLNKLQNPNQKLSLENNIFKFSYNVKDGEIIRETHSLELKHMNISAKASYNYIYNAYILNVLNLVVLKARIGRIITVFTYRGNEILKQGCLNKCDSSLLSPLFTLVKLKYYYASLEIKELVENKTFDESVGVNNLNMQKDTIFLDVCHGNMVCKRALQVCNEEKEIFDFSIKNLIFYDS